jgi:hypothetical protein
MKISLKLLVAGARKLCQNPFRFDRVFLSSSSIECWSSAGILWIPTDSRPWSPSGVSGFWLVGIPTTLPWSGWFSNHSKSFFCFSYVICAFTYHIVELVFVLSYIRSSVWDSTNYRGTQCGDYYLIPQRLTALIWRKILDSAVDVVSEGIIYARGAPGHTDSCGTNRSDSPIRAL